MSTCRHGDGINKTKHRATSPEIDRPAVRIVLDWCLLQNVTDRPRPRTPERMFVLAYLDVSVSFVTRSMNESYFRLFL
ncbi:hypothetical protein J6590_002635 [Homalodisca vitripennis]|nr:hypothetical protein J6590_002635 [Homalodisca vitripennis]